MRRIKLLIKHILGVINTPQYPNISSSSRIDPTARVSVPENLIMGEHSSIGPDATIINSRAKVIIGHHFMSGPKLTIITGDHMPKVGKFLIDVKDADKDVLDINHEFDQDVIIKEDVWTGYGVMIMKGITIGRGAVIAAGSIVTHSVPPYSVWGGVPARHIKYRWTVEDILEHERLLYPENERYSRDDLEKLMQMNTPRK